MKKSEMKFCPLFLLFLFLITAPKVHSAAKIIRKPELSRFHEKANFLLEVLDDLKAPVFNEEHHTRIDFRKRQLALTSPKQGTNPTNVHVEKSESKEMKNNLVRDQNSHNQTGGQSKQTYAQKLELEREETRSRVSLQVSNQKNSQRRSKEIVSRNSQKLSNRVKSALFERKSIHTRSNKVDPLKITDIEDINVSSHLQSRDSESTLKEILKNDSPVILDQSGNKIRDPNAEQSNLVKDTDRSEVVLDENVKRTSSLPEAFSYHSPDVKDFFNIIQETKNDREEIPVDTVAHHTKIVDNLLSKLQEIREFNIDEKMCFIFQQNLQRLPGYSPVDTSFLGILQSNAGKMPKTFRSMALEILLQQAVLMKKEDENSSEADEIIQMVAKLRRLKKEYNQEIIKNNPKAIRIKEEDETEIRKKILKLTKERNTLERNYKDRLAEREFLENQLDELVKEVEKHTINLNATKDSKEFLNYEDLVATKTKIQDNIDLLGNMNSLIKFQSIDYELIKQCNAVYPYLQLKKMLTIISKASRMEFLLKQGEFKNFESNTNSLSAEDRQTKVKISKTYVKMHYMAKYREQHIEIYSDDIIEKLEAMLGAVENKIKTIKPLTKYKETFEKFSKHSEKVMKLERELLTTEKQLDDMQEFLVRKGLECTDDIDFIIPPADVDFYENEYRGYLRTILKINSSKPQEEQAPLVLESSEDAEYMRKVKKDYDNIKTMVIHPESPLDNNFEAGKMILLPLIIKTETAINSHNDQKTAEKLHFELMKVFEMDKKDEERLQQVRESAEENFETIQKLYNYSRHALEMAKDISKYELKVDKKLGELLAEIYRLDDDTKCLSDTNFAFDLFNLGKINVVYDVAEFINSFLLSLAQKTPQERQDAKRLMILLSSLFESEKATGILAKKISGMTEVFLDEEKKKEEYQKNGWNVSNGEEAIAWVKEVETMQKKTLSLPIRKFSRTFSIMMDSYKELTDYAKDLASQKNTIFRRIVARFKTILFGQLMYVLQTAAEEELHNFIGEMFAMAVSFIVDSLISNVILLDFIVMLRDWIHQIITNCVLMFIKFLLRKMGFRLEDVFKYIGNFIVKLGKAKAQQKFIDLDWKKLIMDRGLPNPEDAPSFSDVKPEELETVFFEASQNMKDSYNQLENLSLFEIQPKESDLLVHRTLRELRAKQKGIVPVNSNDPRRLQLGSGSFDVDLLRKSIDIDNMSTERQLKIVKALDLGTEEQTLEQNHRNAFLRGCLALI